MTQTMTRIFVHAVFSTKNRKDLITPDVQDALYAYLGGICRHMASPLRAIGGTANHVHLLVSLSKQLALSDLMMALKRDSSAWIKSKGDLHRDFYWQDGYGAFSVSDSQKSDVIRYIDQQEQRHRTQSFEDEWAAIAGRIGFNPNAD